MAGGIPITDPVELAWCEFARKRADLGIPVAGCGEQSVSIASFKAGAEWKRAACADLVRAAGCRCGGGPGPERDEDDVFLGESDRWHAAWCPLSLAVVIKDQGKS